MIIETIALIVVAGFGIFLVALGATLLFAKDLGRRFLLGFATSAFTHYLEIALRILVGAAIVIASPKMFAGQIFLVFGWMLIATSAVLALVPWQWHHRFAEKFLPPVLKYPALIALVSAVMGAFVIFSAANSLVV